MLQDLLLVLIKPVHEKIKVSKTFLRSVFCKGQFSVKQSFDVTT